LVIGIRISGIIRETRGIIRKLRISKNQIACFSFEDGLLHFSIRDIKTVRIVTRTDIKISELIKREEIKFNIPAYGNPI